MCHVKIICVSLDIFFTFLIFVILLVGTPGPANLILMAAGSKWGVRQCLPFIAGITIGKLFLNVVLALGVLSLLEANPFVNLGLRLASCIYLLWLAWRIAALQLSGKPTVASLCPGFVAGLIVHPLNPKAWAMISSAYAQFSQVDEPWFWQMVIICCTFFAVQCIVHPLWCWGGQALVTHFGGSHWERWIMRGLAGVTALLVIGLTYNAIIYNL